MYKYMIAIKWIKSLSVLSLKGLMVGLVIICAWIVSNYLIYVDTIII